MGRSDVSSFSNQFTGVSAPVCHGFLPTRSMQNEMLQLIDFRRSRRQHPTILNLVFPSVSFSETLCMGGWPDANRLHDCQERKVMASREEGHAGRRGGMVSHVTAVITRACRLRQKRGTVVRVDMWRMYLEMLRQLDERNHIGRQTVHGC